MERERALGFELKRQEQSRGLNVGCQESTRAGLGGL